jgi:hypothetical protein
VGVLQRRTPPLLRESLKEIKDEAVEEEELRSQEEVVTTHRVWSLLLLTLKIFFPASFRN